MAGKPATAGARRAPAHERRRYRRVAELVTDVLSLRPPGRGWVESVPVVWRAVRGGSVSHGFRERLMLTVTAVNGCRACSYLHARVALLAGVTPEDVERLLGGVVAGAPDDEGAALIYAQHWAERDGRPDPDVRGRFRATYGAERAEAIEVVLRSIRIGNLFGNQVDHLGLRARGGRGGTAAERGFP